LKIWIKRTTIHHGWWKLTQKLRFFHSPLHRWPVVGNNGYIHLLSRYINNFFKSDAKLQKKIEVTSISLHKSAKWAVKWIINAII
jgi:hypothetical protein